MRVELADYPQADGVGRQVAGKIEAGKFGTAGGGGAMAGPTEGAPRRVPHGRAIRPQEV